MTMNGTITIKFKDVPYEKEEEFKQILGGVADQVKEFFEKEQLPLPDSYETSVETLAE